MTHHDNKKKKKKNDDMMSKVSTGPGTGPGTGTGTIHIPLWNVRKQAKASNE
jgi:hypothetical protein